MKYLLAMLFKYSQKYYLQYKDKQLSKRIDQYVENLTPEPRILYVYDYEAKQYIDVVRMAYRDMMAGKITALDFSLLRNSKELQEKYCEEYNTKKNDGTSNTEEVSKSIESQGTQPS